MTNELLGLALVLLAFFQAELMYSVHTHGHTVEVQNPAPLVASQPLRLNGGVGLLGRGGDRVLVVVGRGALEVG